MMQDIGDNPNVVFSCVAFNETAEKLFEAEPPSVAAGQLKREGITPTDGTVYMAGWHAAYYVIERDREIAAGTRRACVVFLSDGGPGDLDRVPPALGQEQMECRVRDQTHQSAVSFLRRLASRLREQLDVHMIGIGDGPTAWLERLRLVGEMHGARTSTFTAVDVIDTATSAVTGTSSQTTSLMDAFRTVSTSITEHTTRGTAAGKRRLRAVKLVPVPLPSAEGCSYTATLMRMAHAEGSADFELTVCPDEVECIVTVQTDAFAAGGQRLAFHMDIKGVKHVAKESRFDEGQLGQLRSHIAHLRTQQVASELLQPFAAEIRRVQAGCLGGPGKVLEGQEIRLDMLEGKIYRLAPLDSAGKTLPDAPRRYVYAELYLTGKLGLTESMDPACRGGRRCQCECSPPHPTTTTSTSPRMAHTHRCYFSRGCAMVVMLSPRQPTG